MPQHEELSSGMLLTQSNLAFILEDLNYFHRIDPNRAGQEKERAIQDKQSKIILKIMRLFGE